MSHMSVSIVTARVTRASAMGHPTVRSGVLRLKQTAHGVSVTFVPRTTAHSTFGAAIGCCLGGIALLGVFAFRSGVFLSISALLWMAGMFAALIALAWGVGFALGRFDGPALTKAVEIEARSNREYFTGALLADGVERFEVVPRGVRVFFGSGAPAALADCVALLVPVSPDTIDDLVTLLEAIDAPAERDEAGGR